ncbi:MAG TPA: AmmeMemoRadiSam system protein A [Desulfurivibrio alkaliphilus]|uniref:AmmeMemoRadiSam system protein A n=1 Tax=Desulfurivibrio alkaliphilus TaxID=427923 RepID=A0A7C2XVM1_9BACT|nr:AmmeMemoRadiSam system protein A [Desulfurivibrio alkaliphilus]
MGGGGGLIGREDGLFLLALARAVIAERLGLATAEPPLPPGCDAALLGQRRGVFVTLKRNGQLRGCIGSLSPRQPLLDGVRQNALNAAFHDPRFPPLDAAELAELRIEVSVLTPLSPLDYTDGSELPSRLRAGRDGVLLEKGGCSATFLPQVWEQLPDPVDFLGHLCLKAGLPADAWRHERLRVQTYQVQSFGES